MAYIETTEWDRTSIRRRGVGIAIALALEALLLLAILSLGMHADKPGINHGLSTFNLEAESESSSASKSSTKTASPVTNTNPHNIVPLIPKPLLPPVNPLRVPPPNPDFIKVSKKDFDDMDISKLPSNGGSGSGQSANAGQGSKGFIGPGGGPGGEPIFDADWYRKPYDAEVNPYFSQAKSIPKGAWAMIACKTAERYHVENCQTMGESPRGTGLAKALRLAAWQFLVKPPRIGDKPQIGVWVRIRFDFTQSAAEEVPDDVQPENP